MSKRKCEVWDFIVDYGIATNEEVKLVIDIMGFNEEALNSIIYARTGFQDMEQYQYNGIVIIVKASTCKRGRLKE